MTDTDRKALVQDWVNTFNSGDAERIAAFYAEDAVNYQVALEPIEGREAIKAMFAREFMNAKMVCIVEQILCDGDWAILEWKDPLGVRGSGFFKIIDSQNHYQRGYWDQLSFLRAQGLPIPKE